MRSTHRWILPGLVLMLLCTLPCAHAAEDSLRYGLFGNVHVHRPPAGVADTIILLSDAAGWSAREDALARALPTHGARVVGIDLPTYLQRLQAISEPCS